VRGGGGFAGSSHRNVTVHAMAPPMLTIRRCILQDAAGRSEACSSGCPFWEQGGAVLDGCCFLERVLPFEDWTPELTQQWLRVRARLEREAHCLPLFLPLGTAADASRRRSRLH